MQTLTSIVSFTSTVIRKIHSTFNWKQSKELNFKKYTVSVQDYVFFFLNKLPFMLLSNDKKSSLSCPESIIPYSRKFWRENILANLAKFHSFAKIFSANFFQFVNYFLIVKGKHTVLNMFPTTTWHCFATSS